MKPFYDHWESYCTAKSYVWVEKYDTREAPDRRVRRLMEAENKKLRDAAKKERNEEIRVINLKYVPVNYQMTNKSDNFTPITLIFSLTVVNDVLA